jgi:hypothetical protein
MKALNNIIADIEMKGIKIPLGHISSRTTVIKTRIEKQ